MATASGLSKVVRRTLDNGMTVIVRSQRGVPLGSFWAWYRVGGRNEVPGITGIAHMFEHMAFKGTQTVGTTDAKAEAAALDRVDAAWDALAAEQEKGYAADSTRLQTLEAEFVAAQEAATQYVVTNDFGKILEENGVRGLNASTGVDFTWYYYSLPSNRIELWARLEGDRLVSPVLREFYTERDVVIEERRFGESSPVGRLIDRMLATA